MVKIDYDFYEAMKNGKISERIFHRERVNTVLNGLNYKNKKVLDFGCGTGPVLIPLAERGVNITGVDVSRFCVDKLKKYCRDAKISAKILNSGNGKLPFKDNTFDIVLLIDVLEHVDNTEKIVAETRRVLKKGGKVFATVPWKYHPIVQFKFLRKMLSGRNDIDEALDKPFTINMIKNLFGGFKIIKEFLAVFFVELCVILEKE